ncbi:MAG: NAD(P)/FAD-dependent oxidoreductase [Bacteroidota bacterium]
MTQQKTLVVIGGGAAGFFCAINAARLCPSLKIILLEKSTKLLSKVKISGGGRCNVTHSCFSISELIKNYPRGAAFLKKSFYQFNTEDTINWFKERQVELKTESDGRMFPVSNSSQTIIDCLLNEAGRYKVEIMMNADAKEIEVISNADASIPDSFNIVLNNKKLISASYICLACGGFPKTEHYNWLIHLGHTISKPLPSLFTFNIPDNKIKELMGITVPNVTVKISGTKLQQQGNLLITHWGMSGPAILKLSAYGAIDLANNNYDFNFTVNWISDFNEQTLKSKISLLRFDIATQKIYNRNPFGLPSRLWEYLLSQCDIKEELRWADLPAKEQNKLIKILCGQEFHAKGKTTFKEEFVTSGGINLAEVESGSMESKIIPRLFFAGELLNIDGITGGFNFQNAWTTGWLAANGIFNKVNSSFS